MKACLVVFTIGFLSLCVQSAWAQKKKIDLDDLTIKGELHNDDRMLILSRQKNELKNYIKFRTNYREEIVQQIPKPQPKRKF